MSDTYRGVHALGKSAYHNIYALLRLCV